MSKKRGKSGVGSATGVARWEQAIIQTAFTDDKWDANVTFLVCNQPEDKNYIDALASVVNVPTRRLFSIITQVDLYNQVKELGNPKGKKPKEVPQNYEVCESCKLHLDNNEDIPLPLLAKLIKFRLLHIKTTDLKRRDAEKKAALEKDKPGKKGDKRDRSKSPKKGGGKKTPDPPAPKKESKLRKRGEEDLDNKYIDDEPDDGPQHYIIIQGFNHPHLIGYLSEIGLNVDCIIKLKSQDYSRFEAVTEDTDQNDEAVEKDEKTLAAEEEAHQEKMNEQKELDVFWSDVLPLLQKASQMSKLHDVARLEYEVKSLIIPENLDDNDQKVEFGTNLFEDIAVMIYDLLDAKRQYQNYLDNIKLINIPVLGAAHPPPATDALSGTASVMDRQTEKMPSSQDVVAPGTPEVDMRYYNELLSTVPLESVSVPLIMHCMLEQVTATAEDKLLPSEMIPAVQPDGLSQDLATHLSSMAFKLGLSEEERKQLEAEISVDEPKPERPDQPSLLSPHDEISLRLNHLKTVHGFNPKEAETQMLHYLPYFGLNNFPRPVSRIAKERASRLQDLLYFCTTDGLSPSEIDRSFKQFVFECMDVTSTDPNGFIVTKSGEGAHENAIPWDDPYPFFKGMIPKKEKREFDLEILESANTSVSTLRSGARTPEQNKADGSRSPTPGPSILKSRSPSPKNRTKSPASGSSSPLKSSSADTIAETEEEISIHQIDLSKIDSNIPMEDNLSGTLHSVRFGTDPDGNVIPPLTSSPEPEKTIDEGMDEVVDAQVRNLDQWCFAEHYEPHVLLQVLQKAAYTLPYVDTYYHKRDHTLMVILHNPHSLELQSYVDWEENLHSNVGFRNYLEHVAESVSEWTKAEEAKHMATQLVKELENIQKDEEAASRPTSASKKKDRTKSPKKSPRGRSSSRSSSQERSTTPSDPFIRQNSLKAWKAEQDAIKQEEEEKERQKMEKRAKSAQKKASREEVEKEKENEKKKRPGSRGSAKSRKSSKPDLEKPAEEPQTEKDTEPEEYWPFTGYDVGNDLIHSSGSVSTLFPSDGGIIRTERVDFVQGSSYVRSTVVKDGHVFNVHIIDPKDINNDTDNTENNLKESPDMTKLGDENDENMKTTEEEEKADIEKSEKFSQHEDSANKATTDKKPRVSLFGSFTAQMADGVVFGLSTYGETGIPSGDTWPINTTEDSGQDSCDTMESKPEPEPYSPPPARSPTPLTKESPSKNKREKSRERDKTPEPSSVPVVESDEPLKVIFDLEEEVVPTPFQKMFITCPDGLQIKYNLESAYGIRPSDAGEQIHVRQCYPLKSQGIHDCEADRKIPAMMESSRVVTPDGIVVKAMMDGTFMVLHADGTVNHLKGFPAAMQTASRTSSPMRGGSAKSQTQQEKPESPRKGRGGSRKPSANEEKKEPEEEKDPGEWITTLPSGERICTKPGDTEQLEIKDVLLSMATDPESMQTFMSRADQVMMCKKPDGSTVVEHEDKTRITVYNKPVQVICDPPKDEPSEGEPVLETILVKYFKVECPGFATVEFDTETGECITTLASDSVINVQVDGTYNIDYCDGSRVEVDPEGAVVFKPKPNNDLTFVTMSQDLMYFMRHHSELICETMDNEGNVFSVKHNGEVIVLMNNGDEDNGSLSSGESVEVKNIEKKIHHFKQHAPRFFIVHSNGSGTELKRFQDVAEFIAGSQEDPNSAVIIEPLPDYPGVTGVTILKPHLSTVSQKWLRPYDDATFMPPGLRSRDLRTVPAKEFKKDGPEFGTELGRGLAIGSAKKVAPLPPQPKCPQVLELQQLVQYNAMTEEMRNIGLQEYAEHVKARTLSIQNMAVEDPCSEEEKIHASDLISQLITQRVINDGISQVYEQATAPPVPSPPPTPQPKRSKTDWERDQRELAEEMENRALLRNHEVPPYFKSELGKAYLLSKAPNMESILKELDEDPRNDDDAAIRSEHSSVSPPQPAAGNTPNKLRPGNPTPSHANGQGSPQGVRPTNPTPAHGHTNNNTDRPGNPTPHQVNSINESQSSHYPIIAEHPEEGYEHEEMKSNGVGLQTDVLGQVRKDPVPLPAYIHAGRPGAQPNNKFLEVEDTVRRHVMTSSIAGATEIGRKLIAGLRGFALLPTRVNFGVLREGYTYHYTVHLKNVGIDACRFKIKQPPPSTGLRVVFSPGLVAAGMKAKLTLEIYAIAVGVEGETGLGSVMHDLEITTETEILTLPIKAIVMTGHQYDMEPPSELAKGVRLASMNSPDTQGIIRPRKELKVTA